MTVKKQTIRRCLYCYNELSQDEIDFHERCSKAFFGTPYPPTLDLSDGEVEGMARQIINRSIAVPGVQPKLSLHLEKNTEDPKKSRLTIVGIWGGYILKPQSVTYPSLPENEDLTMHLSSIAGINTADHSLIRTNSGTLAYITKRFDRTKNAKVPMEDLCQLAELPSAKKYDSSMEKAGKLILKYSSAPGFDVISFFEIVLFSFLTGNADMHLKNFSIIQDKDNQYRLAPAYDLLSTVLALPEDREQMALTLNAKKNKINRSDFLILAERLEIDASAAVKSMEAMINKKEMFEEIIGKSFLPPDLKEQYITLIQKRTEFLKK